MRPHDEGSEEQAMGGDGAGVDAAGEAPLKVKILLAEDSLPNQKLMCRILERAGHSVEAVSESGCSHCKHPKYHTYIRPGDVRDPEKKGKNTSNPKIRALLFPVYVELFKPVPHRFS